MKYNAVCYHNTKLGCFTSPTFDDREVKTIVSTVERALRAECLKQGESNTALRFEGVKFVRIGTYDDETGTLESCPIEELIDCGKLCSTLVPAQDGKE